MIVILPIVFLMPKTPAASEITQEKPSSSLLNPIVFTSLSVQLLLACAIQILVFMRLQRQSWFVRPPISPDYTENIDGVETTIMFWVASFETFAIVFAYSISKPWKRPLWNNKMFCLVLASMLIILLYIILLPGRFTRYWLEMNYVHDIPYVFRVEILCYLFIHLFLSYMFELFVINGPGKKYIMAVVRRRLFTFVRNFRASETEKRYHKLRLSRKRYNQIKFTMFKPVTTTNQTEFKVKHVV
jgi:magnesium-transporting ATPase (P-type)